MADMIVKYKACDDTDEDITLIMQDIGDELWERVEEHIKCVDFDDVVGIYDVYNYDKEHWEEELWDHTHYTVVDEVEEDCDQHLCYCKIDIRGELVNAVFFQDASPGVFLVAMSELKKIDAEPILD